MNFSPVFKLSLFTIFAFTLVLQTAASAAGPAPLGKLLSKAYPEITDAAPRTVIVYLTDKPHQIVKDSREILSMKAIQRRAKMGISPGTIDQADLPVNPSYLRQIEGSVIRVRHALKWFNAVTVEATKSQIEILRTLPFVKQIDLVGKWRADRSLENPSPDKSESLPAVKGTTSIDYGTSYTQLNQIKVPAVHNMGVHGEGVIVGVFDNGFRLLTHHAFDSMTIVATYDFVDHKVSVVPNNTSTSFGAHGVNTLSTIGGYVPGQLIGPAFKASFILARTENDSSETPVEEDNWAAAIEWADSIGVDVTSTSLGYNAYDPPYTSWTWADMDGNTTLITRAADRAVGLGIVVVNSAGNGGNSTVNTLGAPADGDSVIAAGAVDSLGNIASFSSCGPTADGRVKPDISAMGVSVKVASSTNISGYGRANGTSFSCPLSAGVAALIVSAHPSLTPMQVRDAMRNTASKAGNPDNRFGWGILNALAAVNYFNPTRYISGTVFNDLNGDGVRQGGEPVLAGISVELSGSASRTVTTSETGEFLFDSLLAGSYAITAHAPGALVTTPPDTIALDSIGASSTGHLIGMFTPGSISGFAFNDLNHNAVYDAGDSVLVGWRIYLSGARQDSILTDSTGAYQFSNLAAGSYTLSQMLPAGWSRTIPSSGTYNVHVTSGSVNTSRVFGNVFIPSNAALLLHGWDLVSLPQVVTQKSKDAVFPGALSNAYIFNAGYQVLDSLANRVGFWIKLDADTVVTQTGFNRTYDSIPVRAGWNMIGTLSYPVSVGSIIQSPDSIVTSSYYYYDGAYQVGSTLDPWKGYWVKAKAPGALILSASPALRPKAVPRVTQSGK